MPSSTRHTSSTTLRLRPLGIEAVRGDPTGSHPPSLGQRNDPTPSAHRQYRQSKMETSDNNNNGGGGATPAANNNTNDANDGAENVSTPALPPMADNAQQNNTNNNVTSDANTGSTARSSVVPPQHSEPPSGRYFAVRAPSAAAAAAASATVASATGGTSDSAGPSRGGSGGWAIFSSWDDARRHLLAKHGAAAANTSAESATSADTSAERLYRGFHDIGAAITYASGGTASVGAAAAAAASASTVNNTRPTSTSTSSGAAGGSTAAATAASASSAGRKNRKKRKINRQWEESYALVQELRQRTGTFDLPTADTTASNTANTNDSSLGGAKPEGGGKEARQAKKLRRWMADQRTEYRAYRDGKKSGMTEEKLALLGRIGFDFGTGPGSGNRGGTAAGSEVGGDGETNTSTTTIHPNKGRRRMKVLTPQQEQEMEEEWSKQFAEFLAFKQREGHGNVPTNGRNDLSRWVIKQRLEYRYLREGKATYLTKTQLMKLQDAGFVFAPRGGTGTYVSWEDRMQQLREYKAQHGHVKIAVSDPEFGSFVKAQRDSYRRRRDGLPSNMTDGRLEQLQALGFVFEAGQPKGARSGPRKSWDQRFEELLQFKAENGHCAVPQHYPGLGNWVHAQRNGYRMLKEGKKTPMTHQKALKLADAGFIFQAARIKGRGGAGTGSGSGSIGVGSMEYDIEEEV